MVSRRITFFRADVRFSTLGVCSSTWTNVWRRDGLTVISQRHIQGHCIDEGTVTLQKMCSSIWISSKTKVKSNLTSQIHPVCHVSSPAPKDGNKSRFVENTSTVSAGLESIFCKSLMSIIYILVSKYTQIYILMKEFC